MRFDETGHLYIAGCLEEIIVLSNGEKVPPVDMEATILHGCTIQAGKWYSVKGSLKFGAFAVVNQ